VKLYNLYIPAENTVPVVASIPHSGTYIPRSVRKQYRRDPEPIPSPIDWHLDKLYDFLPELGITLIQATHSRYVVNLNRSLNEPLFGPESSCAVPFENACKKPLYDRELSNSEILTRIKRYYTPYHNRLAAILNRIRKEHGKVYLLDLHGYYVGPTENVCLGNVNESTCSERLIGGFENSLKKHGFSVVRNERWIGGYITRHYGSMDDIESLQIELRFPAYLDRESFDEEEIKEWDSEKFRNAKERLRKAFGEVIKELV
jgi:N-formylglutamate deformylase